MRIAILLLAVGCGADVTAPVPDADVGSTVVFLTPTQHLTRASLALRGVRPSIDDLHAVAADPTQLAAIVDRYLATPEFGATIMDLHNDALLLRTELPLLVPTAQPIP